MPATRAARRPVPDALARVFLRPVGCHRSAMLPKVGLLVVSSVLCLPGLDWSPGHRSAELMRAPAAPSGMVTSETKVVSISPTPYSPCATCKYRASYGAVSSGQSGRPHCGKLGHEETDLCLAYLCHA
jgi:hypothetical protein